MRWSYSASRNFRQCQRQWYFKNIVANGRARDPFRRRAFMLSKLQSVSGWRGKIVDHVISTSIIPSLNSRQAVTLKAVRARARDLFDRQLAFARTHPINDKDLCVSDEGDDFALLYDMEYGSATTEEEIEKAWQEIELAFDNLYKMSRLREALKSAEYIVAQRALQFELMEGVTVLAYPDAIAFRLSATPLIVDWKVHAFGDNDASLQLAIYAIALSRAKRHADFRDGADFSSPEDIALIEAQLLTNSVREHHLGKDQIEDAEEYMIASACEISSLTEGKKYTELAAEDFRVALNADACERCAFRSICWENVHAH